MECCEKHLKLVSFFSKMFIHKSAPNFQCKPDVAHSETKLHLPSQFAWAEADDCILMESQDKSEYSDSL